MDGVLVLPWGGVDMRLYSLSRIDYIVKTRRFWKRRQCVRRNVLLCEGEEDNYGGLPK